MESIRTARNRRLRRIEYNAIKFALDYVKALLKKEKDPELRKLLAEAGIPLNKILMK